MTHERLASGLRWTRIGCLAPSVAAIIACSPVTPDSARVYFKTEAPFCGSLVVGLVIDGTVVGRDTVRSGQHSPPYAVSAGTHVIGARAEFSSGPIPWADTTVTLAAGDSLTRVLPFYCS